MPTLFFCRKSVLQKFPQLADTRPHPGLLSKQLFAPQNLHESLVLLLLVPGEKHAWTGRLLLLSQDTRVLQMRFFPFVRTAKGVVKLVKMGINLLRNKPSSQRRSVTFLWVDRAFFGWFSSILARVLWCICLPHTSNSGFLPVHSHFSNGLPWTLPFIGEPELFKRFLIGFPSLG